MIFGRVCLAVCLSVYISLFLPNLADLFIELHKGKGK